MIVGKIEQAIDIAPGYMGYVDIGIYPQTMTQGSKIVKTILDTGFSGYLQLKPHQIANLGFQQPIGTGRMMFANGTSALVQRYLATVQWNGTQRMVVIEESDGPPLLGLSLLRGHVVTLKVEPNGPVTVI